MLMIMLRLVALAAMLVGLALFVDSHVSEPLRGIAIGVLGFSAGDLCARLKRSTKKIRRAAKAAREEALSEENEAGR